MNEGLCYCWRSLRYSSGSRLQDWSDSSRFSTTTSCLQIPSLLGQNLRKVGSVHSLADGQSIENNHGSEKRLQPVTNVIICDNFKQHRISFIVHLILPIIRFVIYFGSLLQSLGSCFRTLTFMVNGVKFDYT